MKTRITEMKNKVLTFSFGLLVLLFTVASPLWATDYYVDQNHPFANDQNAGTIDQPWETITKANQTLTAGDTAYIRAGTYNSYIAPVNSGTAEYRITYRKYGSETVTISGTRYGIYLSDDDYITVNGITFTNPTQGMYITNDSDYNIVDDCTFGPQGDYTWYGSRIYNYSDHNWVKNSTFYKFGKCPSQDLGLVLELGYDDGGASDEATYNLIENCTLYHGGHHVLGVHGRYNVIRNNYLHNEAWCGAGNAYGNRTIQMSGNSGYTGHNLFENNRFGYSDKPVDDTSGTALVGTSNSDNIWRYNSFYHGNTAGMSLYIYDNNLNCSNNKIYNNTFFNNGNPSHQPPSPDDDSICAIYFNENSWFLPGAEMINNAIKNNLYYSHDHVYGDEGGAAESDQIYANNFGDDADSVNPSFVDADTTRPSDKTDSSLPNLNLQSGSPAIDAGGPLTTVADTGSGTSLIVDDAGYFQDGTWGPSYADIEADWIAVGPLGNVVQISSINYSTNTITLASSITRNDGDPVWLYKKSDGTQVLYGSAPDAGAYEFSQMEVAPSAPTNLRIIYP